MQHYEVEYRVEGENYAVYHGPYRMFATKEIALLINKNGFTLVNHGPVGEVVARHAQLLRACMGSPDMAQMGDALEVISGKFDVATVNRIIQRKESARALYLKLEKSAASQTQELLSRFTGAPA